MTCVDGVGFPIKRCIQDQSKIEKQAAKLGVATYRLPKGCRRTVYHIVSSRSCLTEKATNSYACAPPGFHALFILTNWNTTQATRSFVVVGIGASAAFEVF